MLKLSKFLHLLVAIVVLLGMIGPAAQPAYAGQLLDESSPRRAHPSLIKLAAEHPGEKIRVIIQKGMRNRNLPDQVLSAAGGRITRRLNMINGIAVELPARAVAALARNPKIRWISLDVPMRSSQLEYSTVREEFNVQSFNNNNGAEPWAGSWIEVDPQIVSPGTEATAGQVLIANGALRLDDSPDTGGSPSAARRVDLGNTTSAYINFDYSTSQGVDSTDHVVFEVSNDGGLTYTVLETFSGITGASSGNRGYDLTSFISSNTTIRFSVSRNYGASDEFFSIDNIQIEYTRQPHIDPVSLTNDFVSDIGANQLWNDSPYLQGEGVTVAVVDSGIADHIDFQTEQGSRLIASVNFSSYSSNANDDSGHGTHVAGIIGGDSRMTDGETMGVAPRVNLINVKVSNGQGMSLMSDVLSALEWIYNNKDVYNIRVVNLSFNSTVPEPYHVSPLSAAVELLWFNGIVVVVSAGNNGTGIEPVTVFPPANDPFVITVGAADQMTTLGIQDDHVAFFSAYGTTEDGFIKPDIVAPGRNITSAFPGPDARLSVDHPTHFVTPNYFRMSGTSMAAPVVTGAVALLIQNEPYLTPDQVKYRLMATANTNWQGYDPAKAGAGYLDAYNAIFSPTTDSSNYGLLASELLWNGEDQISWGTVTWNSVSWNSVSWNSVSWNSVSWNSVSWNSTFWDE